MHEVPRIATRISEESTASGLISSLAGAGESPNRKEAELLLAQIWLETGRGMSCFNFNVGNITASTHYDGGAWRPPWYTVDDTSSAQLKKLHEAMLKGQAPSAFRAYATLEQGMGDYVHLLFSTFKSIVEAARTGDSERMATAIRKSGYTPDAPEGTGRSLELIAQEFRKRGTFAALPLVGSPEAPPAADFSPPAS